jgi:small subunit ribosomal protein S20
MAKRTASAKKQARAGAKRTVRNRAVRSSVKTMVVKARRALVEAPSAENDRAEITLEAIRHLDRAGAKGVLHPRNAARRKSRLARQLARIVGAAPAPAPAAKGKKAAPARAAKAAAPAPASAKAAAPKKK